MGSLTLKTVVSHRGTETTEAADKERHLQKVLKNCSLGVRIKYPKRHPLSHWLCALLKLSHSFNSVATPTAGFSLTGSRTTGALD